MRRRAFLLGAAGGAMTLTFLDPLGLGDGSLKVAPQRAPGLDPLLSGAQLYIDAARNGGSGVNEGTGGSGLDATVGTLYDPADEVHAVFDGDEMNASTCPDAADLDLPGGLVVWVDLEVDWQPALAQQILAKPRTGDLDTNDCYAVGYDSSGHPFVEVYDTGEGHIAPAFITDNGATATVTIPAGVARRQFGFEIIADDGDSGHVFRFYSGTPDDYTLESEIVGEGTLSIETSDDALRVGDPIDGKAYRVRLYDALGGTLLRDFYPARDWEDGDTITSGGPEAEEWSDVVISLAEINEMGFTASDLPDEPHFMGRVTVDHDAVLNLDPSTDGQLTVAFLGQCPDASGTTPTTLVSKGLLAEPDTWGVIVYDAFGGLLAAVTEGGNPTASASVTVPANSTQFLAVARFDGDAETLDLWKDGTPDASPGDLTAVGDLTNTVDLVIGDPDVATATRAVLVWDRALTDTEITVDLPAALGVA